MNRRHTLIAAAMVLLLAVLAFGFWLYGRNKKAPEAKPIDQAPAAEEQADVSSDGEDVLIQAPLDKYSQRVTKKPFGIYVSPARSPVQPERFTGYHTGTDFEILPGEEDSNVPVRAICDGRLLVRQNVSGYGGVLVQSCTIESIAVTVLYGHVDLGTASLGAGDLLKRGTFLANLGAAYSAQTGGERKHLHLGIHRGKEVVYLGYVGTRAALGRWLDFGSLEF